MSAVETPVLRLSNSEMKLWRSDPRHWYLAYYRELAPRAPDIRGSAHAIGNFVHDALAAYYDQENSQDPVAFANRVYETNVAAYPMEEPEIRKEFDLVHPMLQGYMEWLEETGADSDLRFMGSERTVEVQLVPGIHLLSKLDAPVERVSDGAKLAIEHKTTGSLDTPLAGAKLDTQFLTEHLARFLDDQAKGATAEEAYDQCQGILLNQLKKVKRMSKAKAPFYNRMDVPHNIHELRNHWKHVVATGRQILAARARLDAGESHHVVCPPNPTRESGWNNPFFKVYVMADDGSDFEGVLAELYRVRDPLERYEDAVAL